MSEDLVMKEIFGKKVDVNPYNGTLTDPLDGGEWAVFTSEVALLSAAHAINSHDTLVAQLAESKVEISNMKNTHTKMRGIMRHALNLSKASNSELVEALKLADSWLDIEDQYPNNPVSNKVKVVINKHKED